MILNNHFGFKLNLLNIASYPMGTRGSFPGGKMAGAWSLPLISI